MFCIPDFQHIVTYWSKIRFGSPVHRQPLLRMFGDRILILPIYGNVSCRASRARRRHTTLDATH